MSKITSKNNANKSGKIDLVYELKSILIIILIALSIRTFVMEPFYIPSSSMEDTLLEGDYIFSTKFSYGFSNHSFPFSPDLFKGRILAKQPNRGDIVIFWPPNSMEKRYVKRLIGLPGDRVQIIKGTIYINNKIVPQEFMGKVTNKSGMQFNRYKETLDNGVSYFILHMLEPINKFRASEAIDASYNNTKVFEVPEGHYFFMGDNRFNSGDSRMWGFAPFEKLIGKAQIIFFSTEHPLWLYGSSIINQLKQIKYWITSIRFERMFKSVYSTKLVKPEC